MTVAPWIGSLVPIAAALLAALVALSGNHWLQHRVARRARDADDLKARLLIVMTELGQMQHHSKRLRRWFQDTQACRLDMMDAATGGCFQQGDWASDPNRVTIVAREMGRITRTLRDAC